MCLHIYIPDKAEPLIPQAPMRQYGVYDMSTGLMLCNAPCRSILSRQNQQPGTSFQSTTMFA